MTASDCLCVLLATGKTVTAGDVLTAIERLQRSSLPATPPSPQGGDR